MRSIFVVFLIFIGFSLFGQEKAINSINEEVRLIEANKTLNQKQFKKEELTDDETDVGDILKVWWKGNQIYKIREEDKCSFGQITRIIYLKDGNPIKMLQIEKACQDIIYIFKWEDYTCKLAYKISAQTTCKRRMLEDGAYVNLIDHILFNVKFEMELF